MFKRQQNESPYAKRVTVTDTVFTERTLAEEPLVKTAIANFMSIQQTVIFICNVTDGLTAVCVLYITFSFLCKNLKIIHLRNWKRSVAEY